MAWNEPGGKGNPNDPWGNNNRGNNNRGGGGQPPDLDEALKQLLDKLNSLFGGKGSGGGNNNNSNGNGGIGGMLVIAGAILVVMLGFNSVYTLDETERGVVLRLGKYSSTENPGLRFKIPLVDHVIPVNTTGVREVEVKERMLTEDENIVEIELSVQYRVSDPVAYALRVESPERTLVAAAESALRHAVGSTEMDQILTIGRNLLADQVQIRLQDYLDRYQTGMVLNTVNIKDARPPTQVAASFDDVQKAKQDKDRFISESEAYANSVVPEARGRAQRQLEEASAYKEQVIARAEGQAARFNDLLAEYRKAPKVMRERLYIDAISDVYTQSSKVLVDVDGGNNMMYLPLDQLMKAMPASQAASGSGQLTSSDISRLTDQVLEEVRSRQSSTTTTTRREGR
ncbi:MULTISPECIES: FtsH protease activity modulator HflK [unclassified Oceanobacter]|jgi:membrane protease subunit HflK|uniref:FtsH protease activity modulator HflK n=1 Tax=unclassified Oceanobacter TaxID=2620260 RepID=UPI0026E2890E|nr:MULTISPECIES: FtsH protease activity modulator HflK [unclassified Oceanobacter]MDO6682402.1 FtsH protease activity modulator HflK [Oceanobacter sp. 5_MG-2023]MDP2505956.1 FtsH protease activity modulator HflK [Oceanobacter sp. 3_MG-2023]